MPSSPNSKKIHVDIDPSSINKNVRVHIPIVGDAESVLQDMVDGWKAQKYEADQAALKDWWGKIDGWREKKSFSYDQSGDVIKPQYALDRLYEITKERDPFVTTDVGQHQMVGQRNLSSLKNRFVG